MRDNIIELTERLFLARALYSLLFLESTTLKKRGLFAARGLQFVGPRGHNIIEVIKVIYGWRTPQPVVPKHHSLIEIKMKLFQ